MTEYAIREYASGDVPALTALWRRTFGDGERLLADFFRLLPDMGTGVVAEGGGHGGHSGFPAGHVDRLL